MTREQACQIGWYILDDLGKENWEMVLYHGYEDAWNVVVRHRGYLTVTVSPIPETKSYDVVLDIDLGNDDDCPSCLVDYTRIPLLSSRPRDTPKNALRSRLCDILQWLNEQAMEVCVVAKGLGVELTARDVS